MVTAILNSRECTALIESLVFWDSKRPITKKLLARLDLNRMPVDADAVVAAAQTMANALDVPFDVDRAVGLVGRLGQGAKPESSIEASGGTPQKCGAYWGIDGDGGIREEVSNE